MSKYKQTGLNLLYPKEIEVWRPGMEVPDWLCDVCKVHFDDGKLALDIMHTNSGGYQLMRSGTNQGVLVSTESESDYIIKDVSTFRYMSISPRALELMYKKC